MGAQTMQPLPLSTQQWEKLACTLKLTGQQKQIVELILRNCSDQQIVLAMRIKKTTIRTYLVRIFQRLDVADRLELVLLLFALSHGMNTH